MYIVKNGNKVLSYQNYGHQGPVVQKPINTNPGLKF